MSTAHPLYKAKGAFQSGTAALTVPFPTTGTYAVGDFALLLVESANQAIATPSGWTQLTNSPQATGSVMLAAFWLDITSTSMASVSVADTGNHTTAQIYVFEPAAVHVTAGTVTATAATNHLFSPVTTTVPNCALVFAMANDLDLDSTTNINTWYLYASTTETEIHDQVVSAGTGGGLAIAYAGLTNATTTSTGYGISGTASLSAQLTIALRPKVIETAQAEPTRQPIGYFAHGTSSGLSGYWQGADKLNTITGSIQSSSYSMTGDSYQRRSVVGLSSKRKGYLSGGLINVTPYYTNAVTSLDFTTEQGAAVSSSLSTNKSNVAGASSETAGYAAGGVTGTSTRTAAIERITFSSETFATLSAVLPKGLGRQAGASSSTKGYFVAGSSYSGAESWEMYVDGIVFSTETMTTPNSILFGDYGADMGSASSGTAGYFAGGYSGSYTNRIRKLTFSTETAANISATLSVSPYEISGVQSSSSGYFGGGRLVDIVATNVVRKLDFSTETATTISATLSASRTAQAGLSDPGGSLDGATLGADILNMSESASGSDSPQAAASYEVDSAIAATATDTQDTTTAGILPVSLTEYGGALDSTDARGPVPASLSAAASSTETNSAAVVFPNSIEHPLTATDTTDAHGPVPASISESLAPFGIGRGYVCGGSRDFVQYANVSRIQFENEAVDTLSATLPLTPRYPGSAFSATRGYISGGTVGSGRNDFINDIYGLLFADETSFSLSAKLATKRANHAGVQSSVKCYFGGGQDYDLTHTEIDGVQFSDDSAINPSAALATARWALNESSSTTKGYFIGGYTATDPSYVIEGITFATEAAFSLGVSFPRAHWHAGSVGSSVAGYFGGGMVTTSYTALIDRFRFSDETATLLSAALTKDRAGIAGVSSETKGYFCGGYNNVTYIYEESIIDGVRFSDDSAITTSAALPSERGWPTGFNTPATSVTGRELQSAVSTNVKYVSDSASAVDLTDAEAIGLLQSISEAMSATASADGVKFGMGVSSDNPVSASATQNFTRTIAKSFVEAMSALAIQDSAGQQHVSSSATASASSQQSQYSPVDVSALAALSALVSATAIRGQQARRADIDELEATAVWHVQTNASITAPLAATSTQNHALALAVSEALAAVSAQAGGNAMPVDAASAATATSTQSGAAGIVVADLEVALASSRQSFALPVALSEAATAAHTQDGGRGFIVAGSGAASAAATAGVLAVFSVANTASGSASATPAVVMIAPTAIAEHGAALAGQSAGNLVTRSVGEAGAAVSTQAWAMNNAVYALAAAASAGAAQDWFLGQLAIALESIGALDVGDGFVVKLGSLDAVFFVSGENKIVVIRRADTQAIAATKELDTKVRT